VPVRVVTDSSADLSPALLEELSIEVAPLMVSFGDEEFRDGVDLSTEAFWARLRSSSTMPRTAAPSPGAFAEAYARSITGGASAIVCVTLSSRVSAAYQAAQVAAQEIDGRCPIAVVDSRSVSAALGNLCLAAARRGASGADLAAVVAELDELKGRAAFWGAVETLEYLRRNGRIGAARAFLGTALSIRPLLRFDNGAGEACGRVSTRRKAFAWLVERLEADLPVDSVAAFHADAPDIGVLVEMLAARVPGQRVELSMMGPVVGAHVGPGTVGVAYFVRSRPPAPARDGAGSAPGQGTRSP